MLNLLVMFAISILLVVFGSYIEERDFPEWSVLLCVFGFCATGVFAVSMLFVFGLNTFTKESDIAKIKQEYNAITYKMKSEKVRDDFGLLNKEIVDEIQDFNERKAKYEALSENKIIGFAFPDVYEGFEFIEYE